MTAEQELASLRGFSDAVDGKGLNALYGRHQADPDLQWWYDQGYAQGTAPQPEEGA